MFLRGLLSCLVGRLLSRLDDLKSVWAKRLRLLLVWYLLLFIDGDLIGIGLIIIFTIKFESFWWVHLSDVGHLLHHEFEFGIIRGWWQCDGVFALCVQVSYKIALCW